MLMEYSIGENVHCVSKLQKWVAHVILHADIRERSVGPFGQLDWLLLRDESKSLKVQFNI